jgi:hypothetical protein
MSLVPASAGSTTTSIIRPSWHGRLVRSACDRQPRGQPDNHHGDGGLGPHGTGHGGHRALDHRREAGQPLGRTSLNTCPVVPVGPVWSVVRT